MSLPSRIAFALQQHAVDAPIGISTAVIPPTRPSADVTQDAAAYQRAKTTEFG